MCETTHSCDMTPVCDMAYVCDMTHMCNMTSCVGVFHTQFVGVEGYHYVCVFICVCAHVRHYSYVQHDFVCAT